MTETSSNVILVGKESAGPRFTLAFKIGLVAVGVQVVFLLLLLALFEGGALQAAAEEGRRPDLGLVVALGLGGLVVVIVLNWLVWHRVVGTRLQLLTEACNRLAQGDFAQRVAMPNVLGPDEFNALSQALNAALVRIQQQHLDLQEQATHDGLTNLLNKRALTQRLAEEVARSLRYGQSLSLIMMDVDGFKIINDRYGHPAGDRLLADFAQKVLKPTMRATDIIARYGGDEFVVLMPQTNADGAREACKRLVQRLEEFLRAESGITTSLTVSCGYAALPQEALTADDLVQFADRRMYDVKRTRQNVA